MYQNERELEIQKILSQEGYASVQQLSQWLYTSQSSIRRDLTALEKRGIVKRSYGGAELVKNNTQVLPFSARAYQNIPAKKAIAKKAVQMVRDGDIVFLDQSSSAFFVACELQHRADITVVTNNIEILSLLTQSELEVLSCGGRLGRINRSCLLGEDAHRMFRQLRADVLFFSTRALSEDGVIYDCDREEVCIRETMLQNAARKVFLCASEKFGHYAGYRQCQAEELDCIITETEDKSQFRPLGELCKKII